MKTNIHLVSHPVIQKLSNLIIRHNLPDYTKNQALKRFGLLLTYEAIRNWSKNYKITIQQVLQKQEIVMADPKESYIIIFNNLNYLSFLQDIQDLIPESRIEYISEYTISKKTIDFNNLKNISSSVKVIIAIHRLNAVYISKILQQLTEVNNILLNQIRIVCTLCRTDQLIEIDGRYKSLNIYTSSVS